MKMNEYIIIEYQKSKQSICYLLCQLIIGGKYTVLAECRNQINAKKLLLKLNNIER